MEQLHHVDITFLRTYKKVSKLNKVFFYIIARIFRSNNIKKERKEKSLKL